MVKTVDEVGQWGLNRLVVGEKGCLHSPCEQMSQSPQIEPIYYNSVFKHGVDDKRRLAVPAKWRPADETVEFTLMVFRKHQAGACLRVLPPKEMAELVASIDAMPNSDPNKTVLKRIIGAESVQVVCDKAGRICLPPEMATAADIADEAVLVGLLDRFEIWSPRRFENVKAADAVHAPEAFKLME